MADKSISFASGEDNLRPITNARCVMMEGVGSLHNARKGAVQVPLGIIADGSITSASRFSSTKFSGMTTSVVMKEPFVTPFVGVKFNVHIDSSLEGLQVKVYYGYNEGMSSTTSNVSKYSSPAMVDGDSFAMPIDNYNVANGYDMSRGYYRIAFISSSLSMDYEDIAEAIRLGYIAVTYEDPCSNVVARNPRATEVIEVSKTFSASTPRHRNFVFTHVSDLHSHGIALMDALKYSKAINSQGLFITGDVAAQSSYDGYGYVHEFCKNFPFPSFLTTGNHDGVGVSSLATFNNAFFAEMTASFGYTRGSGQGYYYKDLAEPKIRIIVLDCCDSSASYRTDSVGSAQISWLQNTLANTPSGYGVIIAMHQPVGNPTAASRKAHPSFAQCDDFTNWGGTSWTGASDIRAAVDSFIGNGGEFIMYCCGHQHADSVGIIGNTSHTQLQACIGTPNGNQDMQQEIASVGDGMGSARDLFNAYIIDRTRHTVRVVRVGANTCEDLSERLVEEFSYV